MALFIAIINIKLIMGKRSFHILIIMGFLVLFLGSLTNPKIGAQEVNNNKKAMVNNLKLQVKVRGEGAPLLLLPGGLTGWKSWESFEDDFIAKQRKVIRVQLLSVEYGIENRKLPSDYSVKTESRALKATLDSLGYLTPVDLVAWSFGAFVSLDFALDNPERIRTLTLIEPPAIWVLGDRDKLDAHTQHTLSFLESLHGDITDDMLAGFLLEVGLAKPGQSPRELPQWQQWLPFKQSLRNSPAVVVHKDDIKRLRNLKMPVLLVKGTGSAPFLHKIIDNLALNLPNSQVIELPGGHAPQIVSRDRFLAELDKFWKSQLH
jgi:pimeloyl-ACP methyl ester carboxylesterase